MGNGRTVVRGGYRLLYDPPYYNIYLNVANAAPQVFLQSFTGPSAAAFPIASYTNGRNVRAQLAQVCKRGFLIPARKMKPPLLQTSNRTLCIPGVWELSANLAKTPRLKPVMWAITPSACSRV